MFTAAGLRIVRSGVRMPRMNSIMERWIGGCRRELLDRTLIWNLPHLRRILAACERHHNDHRPHMALSSAAPLKPLPAEITDLEHSGSGGATTYEWVLRHEKLLGEYRGEFRVSGELSAGHFRYDSGLRDRSAGFERFWKLISIAELAAPLAVELLYMRLLAEASLPSLCT